MTDYAEAWKQENPYDDNSSYCGPNSLYTVPRTAVSEGENRLCYEHDACYENFTDPYTGWNYCDANFIKGASGTVTKEIGARLFSLKSMLPKSKLKPGVKPQIHLRIRGGGRSGNELSREFNGMDNNGYPLAPAPKRRRFTQSSRSTASQVASMHGHLRSQINRAGKVIILYV